MQKHNTDVMAQIIGMLEKRKKEYFGNYFIVLAFFFSLFFHQLFSFQGQKFDRTLGRIFPKHIFKKKKKKKSSL